MSNDSRTVSDGCDTNPQGWPWTLDGDRVVNVRGEDVPPAELFHYAKRMAPFYSVAGDLWNSLDSWIEDIGELAGQRDDDGASAVSALMAQQAIETYEELVGLRGVS